MFQMLISKIREISKTKKIIKLIFLNLIITIFNSQK